jgi:hypothetical protein
LTPAVRCTVIVTVRAVMLAVFDRRTCSSLNQPLLLVTTPVAVTDPPVLWPACVTAMMRVIPPPLTVTVPLRFVVPVFAVALTVKLPVPAPLVGVALSQL